MLFLTPATRDSPSSIHVYPADQDSQRLHTVTGYNSLTAATHNNLVTPAKYIHAPDADGNVVLLCPVALLLQPTHNDVHVTRGLLYCSHVSTLSRCRSLQLPPTHWIDNAEDNNNHFTLHLMDGWYRLVDWFYTLALATDSALRNHRI